MSSSTSPIRVGFCGYGYSTRTFHLPYVIANPRLAVHSFLQRNPKPSVHGKPGSSAKEDFPNAKVFSTPEEFFKDEELQLVVIATHTDTHASLAVTALEAGKHVVVEKPFAESSESADRIIDAQKKSGKVLTVFQNRRYDSDFRTLSHLVNHPDKPLGKLAEVEIHYDVNGWFIGREWFPMEYKPGEGMMFGIGCHVLDQTLTLFGPPASVTGFYRCQHNPGAKTDDHWNLILQYDRSGPQSDLLVYVKCCTVNVMTLPIKYWARGDAGTFIKYGEDPQESQTNEGMKPTDEGYGIEPEETYGVLTTLKQFHEKQTKQTAKSWQNQEVYEGKFPSFKGDCTGYYEDVVKAVLGEGEVVVKPELARNGIRVMELGRQSAEEGRTLKFD